MNDSATECPISNSPDSLLVGRTFPIADNSAQSSTLALPLLFVLFIGSGCAALIYEVVWLQLLQLNLGSSAVSVGVLLAVYMGGMCLGSLLLPRRISPRHHPLKVYALLELGIGAFGLIALYAVPAIGKAYTVIAGDGPANLILRTIVASICLLPPTLLMGATLPAIGRWVQTTPAGASWLGFFYAGNLVGAVAGSLVAGYYLLRLFDMPTASFVAVGINAFVATLAWVVARFLSYRPPSMTAAEPSAQPASRLIYVGIALSGFTALGAEVVWTRLLALHFGATTYTFSLILAVILLGLGLGSSIGSAVARRVRNARPALGWCQLLLCGGIAWAAHAACTSLKYWEVDPTATSLALTFKHDVVRAIWAVLPSAILWGASFPLAVAAVLRPGQDSGRLVGGIYAANTLGAIFGAAITSLVLVGNIGSKSTQQILIIVSALSGFLMLALPTFRNAEIRGIRRALNIGLLGIAAVASVFLVRSVPPLPGILVAYGRNAASWDGYHDIVYVGEGRMASVAVTRDPTGILYYHNAGKVQASSDPADMRLQRMLGHITTLVPKSPQKVLVIGCGAGVTAGAVSLDPLVKDQTIAEIEPLVPHAVSTYFSEHNFAVVSNPKVKVHLDDARHFLLTTHEKFDAITSDPLDPWVKGAATLYTLEFFEVVKQHLNSNGVMTLFVQLYENDESAVKSQIATFLKAFPNGAVFANTVDGEGYDLVLYGPMQPHQINLDEVQERLNLPENAPIVQSLQEIGINSAVQLFGNYAGRPDDLARWLSDAQINHDRNLRLQFLAGRSLNVYANADIYRHMIQDTRYPENYFVGKPETLAELRSHIEQALSVSR
jgi:spermidine synthase